jgi:hypothetical protein
MRDLKYLYVGYDMELAITCFKGQLHDFNHMTGTTNPVTGETSAHATHDRKDIALSIYNVPHDVLKARLGVSEQQWLN